MNDTDPTIPAASETPNEATFVNNPEPAKVALKKRRQFRPGQRLVDSYKRKYWVDQNGSLRRVEGAKLSKAEKKAAKRQRRLRNG